MADDVRLNTGTGGALVATDQEGTGRHYQWVKLVYGADNTFTKVTASVGLPVKVVTALPAGTAKLGHVGIFARATGGAKVFSSVDLDESHEVVSATPVTVYGMYFW